MLYNLVINYFSNNNCCFFIKLLKMSSNKSKSNISSNKSTTTTASYDTRANKKKNDENKIIESNTSGSSSAKSVFNTMSLLTPTSSSKSISLEQLCEQLNKLVLEVKELNEKYNKVYNDLQCQIADLHTSIGVLINDNNEKQQLVSTNSLNNLSYDKRIDALERQLLSTDVVIDGIPSMQNENLHSIFENFCSYINIPKPNYKVIYRARRKNSHGDSPIIIKLSDLQHKGTLFSAIKNKIKSTKNKITLSSIGLNSNKTIYVHERLTKHNYTILREGLKLKKQHKISSIFTRNGSVHVKKNPTDACIIIRDLSQYAAI